MTTKESTKEGLTVDMKQRTSGEGRRKLKEAELLQLLCILEADLQARDVIIKSLMNGRVGMAVPMSHLLSDNCYATLNPRHDGEVEDDDDIWLGEPTAHLNHVVAYHQLVREQMSSMLQSLEEQHRRFREDSNQPDQDLCELNISNILKEYFTSACSNRRYRKMSHYENEVVKQLEDERHKHAIDTAQGDDVTYMLEKEREKLANQIEFEQAKQRKLEKEKDRLATLLTEERQEQQQTFMSLMNDYKTFAAQLIEYAHREEQLTKEIEQERKKNKVLSELVIEEQRKYKERLKLNEGERGDLQSLKQQKKDLENRLVDFRQKYAQEQQKVRTLEHELKVFKSTLQRKMSSGSSECSDDFTDVLVTVEQSNPHTKQAGRVQISTAIERDTGSPEPVIPSPHIYKVSTANVIRSKLGKQNNKGTVSRTKPPSPAKHSSTLVKAVNVPRERKESQNSDESGGSGKVKKVPPPAPPRTSSISSRSAPASRMNGPSPKSGPINGTDVHSESVQNHVPVGSTPNDIIRVLIAVVTGYGWDYCQDDGIVETNRLVDLLGEVEIHKGDSWETLTDEIDKCFIKATGESFAFDSSGGKPDLSVNSISQYELLGVAWNSWDLPEQADNPWNMVSRISQDVSLFITVTLKDVQDESLDALSYSTFTPLHLLREYIRLIQREKSLLFISHDHLEGRHFVSCFAHWIKANEERKGGNCTILKVEKDAICNWTELISNLISLGALKSCSQRDPCPSKIIVTLDIELLITEGLSFEIFEWLGKRGLAGSFYLTNGLTYGKDSYYLDNNLLILAFTTKVRFDSLDQWVYRIFKILEMSFVMPNLLQRWLRQKAGMYTETDFDLRYVDRCVSWISDVYKRSNSYLSRLDIPIELPGVSPFLSAPMENINVLGRWMKSLWIEQFSPLVHEAVKKHTTAASKNQQELLAKVTLQTLYEKAILPGCPVTLD